MTIRQLFEYGRDRLRAADISDCETDAWYLLSFVTGMDRAGYFLHMEEEAPPEQISVYERFIGERLAHIPLQQLTGEQEFMGHRFLVSPNVLIPRQDTETLVEEAALKLHSGMRVLDLCTGSGCIIVSLYLECPGICAFGADISSEALQIARKNAKINQAEVRFLQGDLFEAAFGKYDMIVSNPPYIRSSVIEGLMEEVRDHEPRLALDGGEDGLIFYRRIAREGRDFLADNGSLFLEIGHDQSEDVYGILENEGYESIRVIKDLAGQTRVVHALWRN